MLDDILLGAALLSVIGWLHLLYWRGSFWRADQRLPPSEKGAPCRSPKVAVIIPARNEAGGIGRSVRSLLDQSYRGLAQVVVVDDNSSDGTAAEAIRAAGGDARLTVLSGAPLARRWTGKLWALHQGIEYVLSAAPDTEFLLLTDADIEHDRANLGRLVATALTERRDMVSLMVRLRCEAFWERLLVPPFIFFFQKLYPFAWVNDPERPEAAAAGGCILVRADKLQSAGSVAAIRGHLIDDCALAERIKGHGGAIWLGLSEETRSLRPYPRLRDVWSMVARTAFTQLDHSAVKLGATVIGMLLLYLTPPLSTLQSLAGGSIEIGLLGAAAWGMMAASFLPTLRLYQMSSAWCLMLPVAACLYVLMTVDSARLSWQGRGGNWKGRSFEADAAADPHPKAASVVEPRRPQ